MCGMYITNGVHGPEPRSLGGNTSSNRQVSALIRRLFWHMQFHKIKYLYYGPLEGYVKLWVTHAPEMPGRFFPPPRVSDPDMHHGTCVIANWQFPLTSVAGKKGSWYTLRMRNPQFCIPGKTPIVHNKFGCFSAIEENS